MDLYPKSTGAVYMYIDGIRVFCMWMVLVRKCLETPIFAKACTVLGFLSCRLLSLRDVCIGTIGRCACSSPIWQRYTNKSPKIILQLHTDSSARSFTLTAEKLFIVTR